MRGAYEKWDEETNKNWDELPKEKNEMNQKIWDELKKNYTAVYNKTAIIKQFLKMLL